MSRRERLTTYAVVVPFAIFLAFPFYFALVTMFKTNLDLADVEHSPYLYNDLEGHFHWDFWNYATTEHVRFLFEDTNYPRWLLNTLLVGAAVVAITLLLAMPAGYALARLAGGWGQGAGVAIFLVYMVGIISTVWHFANGIWLFLVDWGITIGERAQRLTGYACIAFGVVLLLVGVNAAVAFIRPGGLLGGIL